MYLGLVGAEMHAVRVLQTFDQPPAGRLAPAAAAAESHRYSAAAVAARERR